MILEDRPRQDGDTTALVLEGECFIVNHANSELHGLNDVGARIWELVDGTRSVTEIVAVMAGEYDAAPATLEHDVLEYLAILEAKHLVLV